MAIQKFHNPSTNQWEAVDAGAINDGVNKIVPADVVNLKKAPNEYEWTATAGQLTYVMPSGQSYDTTSKWLQVTVGGAPIADSLISKDNSTQFTLLVNASTIPAGVTVTARWVSPFIPATSGHNSTHLAGGNDEIDVTKLKNYDVISTQLAESATDISARAVNTKTPFGTNLTPAKGDATTNDTSAIQGIINYVSSNGGGTVFIPTGTFMIDATVGIQMKSNVTLLLDNGAIIKALTNSVQSYNIINCQDIQNFKIIGGTIQGERTTHTGTGGEWGMGINITGCSQFLIEDVYARDCWGDGIYVGASVNQAYSENGRIVNCTVDNNRRNGFSIISARDVELVKPRLLNTNGTAPQAGIDIEPNDTTNILENIVIRDPYSKNNTSQAIALNLDKLSGSGKTISIRLENHFDDGSLSGFTVQACNGGIYGSIENIRPTYINSHLNGIEIRNYASSGAAVLIHEPTVINPNANNNTLAKYGSGITVYGDSNDTVGRILGNVHIIRPRIRDTRTTTQMQNALLFQSFAGSSNNYNVQNISVIDPMAISGVTAGSAAGYYKMVLWGTGFVSDAYKQLDYSLLNVTNDGSLEGKYNRTVHNENFTADRPVQLSANVVAGWPDVTYEVRASYNMTITPGASDQIYPLTSAAGKYIQSNVVGSRVTLRKIAQNKWFVVDMIGTWTAQA
jgi:hypothetical protein